MRASCCDDKDGILNELSIVRDLQLLLSHHSPHLPNEYSSRLEKIFIQGLFCFGICVLLLLLSQKLVSQILQSTSYPHSFFPILHLCFCLSKSNHCMLKLLSLLLSLCYYMLLIIKFHFQILKIKHLYLKSTSNHYYYYILCIYQSKSSILLINTLKTS